MRVAYLDCASGISGDMTLGALVDAGVPLSALQAGIDSLGLADCRLEAETVQRRGFRALKIHVRHKPEHAHRHLQHITDMIAASQLTASQQALARAIFTRIGEAEARVHGTTLEKVHFHEVGAVDSIADIVGVAIGWNLLAIDRVVCSPIPTGSGSITIAHGRTSVPAPATAELLKGIPLADSSVPAELTTPTGAAMVATLCESFGPLPGMTIESVGYGAGDRDFEEQANVLRLVVGTVTNSSAVEQLCMLETNLDDCTGEVLAHTTERLFAAEALDVFTTPIQMKKGRAAVKLSVLCDPARRDALEHLIFDETTTLGIRGWTVQRRKLARETYRVATQWGDVPGKVAELPDGSRRFSPEFDACRRLAAEHQVAVHRVMEAARRAYG